MRTTRHISSVLAKYGVPKSVLDRMLHTALHDMIYLSNAELAVIFFSSRSRHTRCSRDWSSDVCSSDLMTRAGPGRPATVRKVPIIDGRLIAASSDRTGAPRSSDASSPATEIVAPTNRTAATAIAADWLTDATRIPPSNGPMMVP